MFKVYFILLLLGHILGDFYIQTSKMDSKKEESLKWFLIHCLYYWGIIIFISLPVISWETVLGGTIAAGLHCLIDAGKSKYLIHIKNKNQDNFVTRRNMFFTDQLLHIIRPKSVAVSKNNNAGRFIGTLERIIILIFLSIGQYSAIGLVLTAKSIARYERISKEKKFAEYYLLGTLLSTLYAIIVSFCLIKVTI